MVKSLPRKIKIGVSLAMATQPFRDPLRDPNHPQNPHLDTLGNFFGIEKWFLAILRIIVSFLECKNAKSKTYGALGQI